MHDVLATIALLAVAGVVGWQITELVGPSDNSRSADDPVLALPTGPSIAVLPFLNLSGDPEQEYFADGMTEEIITALTRFHELLVIARNTTFQSCRHCIALESLSLRCHALGVLGMGGLWPRADV